MKVFNNEYRIDKRKFNFVNKGEEILDTAFETEPISYFKDVLIRFCRNKASVVAFVIICTIMIMAAIAPSFNSYKFDEQYPELANMPPKITALSNASGFNGGRIITNRRVSDLDNPNKYPEGSIIRVFNEREKAGVKICDVEVDYYLYTKANQHEFWLGTDYLGRDLWTRLWRGVRVSLFIAFLSVIFNVFLGIILGSLAGYYGGKVDMIIMRFAEVIGAFPRIVIVTMFIMYFGTGLFSIIMALVVKGWIGTCRMIRGQFYRYKRREYVLAARTLGIKDMALIFRHILPNAIGPIITSSMIAVPSAIFAESFLAYIGLGLQAPEPSLGVLLSQGQKVLLDFPNQALYPALVMSALMISFNLFANGLRDAFDPTQRGA